MSAERRRIQRYWEDVREGDEVPSISYDLTMTQLILFVSATQAWSPIHHDVEEARRRGWPDIFPGGMSIQACFSRLLMDYVGEAGWLKKFRISFRKPHHPGTTLRLKGKVIRKYVENGEHLLDLDVWAETDRDGLTAPASAVVRLPSRQAAQAAGALVEEALEEAESAVINAIGEKPEKTAG